MEKLLKPMDRINTRKINEVLKEFLRENNLDVRLKERDLVESWEGMVGRTINRATKNIYIRDRKLFVVLSSSVVRNELYMLKDEIVRKLNERIGEQIITDLVLK
jgi:predicted nucleic acid-binding Zn ribbon protein